MRRAIVSGQVGFATADQWLFVANREGPLSTWLPEVGCSCSECALLVGMQAEFDALRDHDGAKLVLPSIGNLLANDERVTVSISWYSETRHFIILTSSDETVKNYARSIDRRYAEILVSQQAAAVLERSLVLTALYRGDSKIILSIHMFSSIAAPISHEKTKSRDCVVTAGTVNGARSSFSPRTSPSSAAP